ncbi:hypothetical protein [Sphingomonas quercus]|uniref:Uncharacterized protein n=1 Tax=Sphingomonas quercus TaxID=2842451 RepID=A0ABS6BI25_9SPHN|nr:hypothetical protein [Sphingomonas quercus]MBU3077091.1 hypothetical protein [Sphingomonas quercus]
MIRFAPFRSARLAAVTALAAAVLATVAPFLHPPVAVHAPAIEGSGIA